MKTHLCSVGRARFAAALAGAAVLGLTASARATGLTPADVARIRSVTGASVSPDGRHVAFTRLVPRDLDRDGDGTAWVELWVCEAAGGRPRPFVTGHLQVSQIAGTADGKNIAFLAKRPGDAARALYFIPIDGGEARKAAALPQDIRTYSLCRDGERVALVANAAPSPDKLAAEKRGFTQEIYEEESPLARVWVGKLFGNFADAEPLPIAGHVHQVAWRPHAEELAVSVTPTPAVDDRYVRQRVRVVSAADGHEILRIDNPGKLDPYELDRRYWESLWYKAKRFSLYP